MREWSCGKFANRSYYHDVNCASTVGLAAEVPNGRLQLHMRGEERFGPSLPANKVEYHSCTAFTHSASKYPSLRLKL